MGYGQLAAQVKAALEAGELDAREVERLLRRRAVARPGRPTVAGVLRSAGLLVAFAGAALLYAIGWSGYSHAVQLLTPFVFPGLALGVAVGLHRAARPAWEVELTGMVGLLALGLAFLASGNAADAGAGFGTLAGAIGVVVVLALHHAVRLVRLTSWGLSASLVAFSGFAADAAGAVHAGRVDWLLLVQAAVGVAVGAAVVRGRPKVAAGAWRSAALLGTAACSFGIDDGTWGAVGPWHLGLTLVVVATLLAAAAFDMDGLMWVGALAGLVWLGAAGALVGHSGGWALAVVLLGIGLVALSVLINRLRRPQRPRPA
jgi:hypothetical protein